MTRRNRILLLTALLMTAPASCSVLEDRADCPCFLDVDFTGVKAECGGLRLTAGTTLFLDDVSRYSAGGAVDAVGDTVCLAVEKGAYQVLTAVFTSGRMFWDGTAVRNGEGMCFDSLYAASDYAGCTGETAYVRPVPKKQFITVRVTDTESGLFLRQHSLTVKGDVNGLELSDLSPAAGPYEAAFSPEGTGDTLSVRVPRFDGDGFTIEILRKENGGPHHSIHLGEAMRSVGYDFTAGSLDDVLLTLDFRRMTGTIRVSGWDKEKIIAII